VPAVNSLASFSWGTFPLLSLITSLSLGALRVWPLQAEKALRGIYAFTLGLLPVGLCFWYYRVIQPFPHERVYFVYTDALFFLANGLVLLAVTLWFAVKLKSGFQFSSFVWLPCTFCILAFLSVLWSKDWRTSLYVSLSILLIFLFILSLREWPHAWKFVLFGFCAALSIQFIIGVVEFVKQTTTFLAPLKLNWPGPLDPSVPGAIVVQLPSGESFLRVYGTLPHPNILGGFALIFLLAPITFFLRKDSPNNLALLLLIPGVALLALTFSRSAWLALIVFSTVLIWKSQYFERKHLVILLAVIAMSFVITLSPLRALVQARTINTSSHAEEFSFIGRAWLNGEAINMIREVPLIGVGIGSFIIELGNHAGEGYVVEPAHNVLLLAGAELGIPGLLIVIALLISFGYRLAITRDQNAILAGATLTGLAVISMFDHYLWTLAPSRLMLGLMIGLFVGRDINHGA
jgi:O-antigen ligase